MRHFQVSAYVGPISIAISLITCASPQPLLHAQAPAGASVSVRMIEAIDSAKDPAGKQYRASVTRAVNAGNGVMIPQNSLAAVTLVKNGNGAGWTTHLVSVTLNGQPVAVSSGAASVNGGMLSTAGNAMNSMSSMLGGFGHHIKPTSVTAVATGQRVLLPPGATLTFVLSQPPASASAAAVMPSAAATSIAGAQSFYTLCRYQGQQGGHPILYVSPIFHTNRPDITDMFRNYMKVTYDIFKIQQASGYCETVSDSADQQAYTMQQLEKAWADSKTVVTHINWTGTPAEIAAVNAKLAATGSAPGPSQADSSEATAFYCLTALTAQNTIYYSPIEHRGRASTQGEVENAFGAFLQKTYGIRVSTTCTAPMPTSIQDRQQKIEDYRTRYKVVETSWVYTPAGGSAAPVAIWTGISQGAPFISCSTGTDGGINSYVTGVFQTTHPVRHLPNGGNLVDQGVLDRFYAYLTQKGYHFKPGSNYGCAVEPTEAQAKAAQHTRYESGGCSNCGKVVETGWTDTQ